ncbi:FAD/NAD(P)-binding protein [Brachybacterium sp. AOP43-C2-M15]|uniref:FAD/NAD(P)-binding protein n=1 Tax=Brachybacterium sp. AOP43-C2-M15 TaxID=3457661 RepID=UPI0040331BE4
MPEPDVPVPDLPVPDLPDVGVLAPDVPAPRAPRDVDPPLTLAVLGAGPKALFALEALAAHLDDPDHAPRPGGAGRSGTEVRGNLLEVTVIDPAEHPGTGAAYDPEQSPVLRLNVAARLLDAPVGGSFPSFPDWVAEAEPSLAREHFPPRALVGRYLALRWQAMLAALGRHARCQHRRGRAVAVRRDGAQWVVEIAAAPPVAHPSAPNPFDEVLVATGHGAGHDGALVHRWESALPLRPAVFPIGTMLPPALVPPGARAAVRGSALTFLDAALTLTEARGAQFVPDPDRPGRLLHRRSPQEPATLLPTARHGLLLDAKPEPGTDLAAPDSPGLDRARRRLEDLDPTDPDVARHVLAIVTEVAAALLAEDGASDERRRAVESTLATGAEPDLPAGPGRAERALRRSVAVALEQRPPGPAWALGRSWARLYPQVTALLRGSEMPLERWCELRGAAQVLERFAFGPPLITARKLLAMVDSGAVDLRLVDAGTSLAAQGVGAMPPGVAAPDLVIDAVLAPPGVRGLTDPLARQLLRDGLVTVRPGRRGALVAHDGTALSADGRRTEGLALIGRPTEDHVIGHDTLDRHLHGEIPRWAARLAARTDPT